MSMRQDREAAQNHLANKISGVSIEGLSWYERLSSTALRPRPHEAFSVLSAWFANSRILLLYVTVRQLAPEVFNSLLTDEGPGKI